MGEIIRRWKGILGVDRVRSAPSIHLLLDVHRRTVRRGLGAPEGFRDPIQEVQRCDRVLLRAPGGEDTRPQ
jgi:hypothetical protein